MTQRGRIIALASVVIPPANTPQKKKTETLIATPNWKYVGPGDTINFEWQIGHWNSTFNGITARKYDTRSQVASSELKQFTTDLTAIPLSGLTPGYYDCEIWFKDKFEDLRVIVQNCVKIVEEALQVIVAIKNPPSGATLWTLALCDWAITTLFHFVGWGTWPQDYLDMAEKATFEVPSGVTLPLRVVRLQICKWNADKTALIELYYFQSYQPSQSAYKEIFIPQLGNYSYNVATERFESA